MSFEVGILLPKVGVYPSVGSMLADAFRELGWHPTVGHRAHPGLLGADLLLLAGLCRYIEGLPELLTQRRRKSPATILWQLEPLPPVQLSTLGEQVGRRLAAYDWGRIPPATRRVLNQVVPFRTQVMRALRRWKARAYTREAVGDAAEQGWIEYDVENYFNAVADWNWTRHAHEQGWLDYCFASVQPRVRFLRSRGIGAEMIPFGYHRNWGHRLNLTRDIDVLFLGTGGRGPRKAKLRQVNDALIRLGRTLTLVPKAQGAAREEWLSRARIMLNLLRAPHDLAGLRVLMGMACGALVVSEQCADTGAFVPGKHLVMAPVEAIATTIDQLLNQDEARMAMAAEGHRFVTEELTLPRVLRRMLAFTNFKVSP